jgi:sugar phosphate isomerase/epimerase
MYIGIRDVCLFQAGYENIAEGMAELEIGFIELAVDRNMCIPAAQGNLGRPRLSIADELAAIEASESYARLGIQISGLLLANNFNAHNQAAEIEWGRKALDVAEIVGADAVRIDAAMTGQQTLPLSKRVDIFAGAVEEVLAMTVGGTVALAVENHGLQGNDPQWLTSVLQRVRDERFGLTLDAANFYWAGYPLSQVYQIVEQLAPDARHVHCKNLGYPPEYRERRRSLGWQYGKYVVPIGDGDIDHAKIVAILAEAGYQGGLYIEDESLAKFSPVERGRSLRAQADYLADLVATHQPGLSEIS